VRALRRDKEQIARLRPQQHRDFHETLRRLTRSPVQRYISGEKKRWFKFPIQLLNRVNFFAGTGGSIAATQAIYLVAIHRVSTRFPGSTWVPFGSRGLMPYDLMRR